MAGSRLTAEEKGCRKREEGAAAGGEVRRVGAAVAPLRRMP